MPSFASSVESQSSEGPDQKQWLPTLISATLLLLAVASAVGVALSATAFSDATELGRPGQAITQSFVLFSSVLSLFYIAVHIFASRKGESLHFDPPIPSFRHQLHAWSTILIRLAATMWASAIAGVAVNIHRDRIDDNNTSTMRLSVDMFACATGVLTSAVLLSAMHFSHRPFALPWITPELPPFDEEDGNAFSCSGGGASDDDKTSATITATPSPGSSSSDDSSTGGTTLRGSPTPSPQRSHNVLSAAAPTSRSPSSRRARARKIKMTRTRRYVLEGAVPVSRPVTPLKRQPSGNNGSGGKSADSIFAASAVVSSPEQQKRTDGKGTGEKVPLPPPPPTTMTGEKVLAGARQQPGAPGMVRVRGRGQAGNKAVAVVHVVTVGPRRRPAGGREMPVGGSTAGGGLPQHRDGGGAAQGGQSLPSASAAAPSPVPAATAAHPLPPPPTYSVPGAWI